MSVVAGSRVGEEELESRGRGHALLLLGDFNAPLGSSAVASFLSFGSVLRGPLRLSSSSTACSQTARAGQGPPVSARSGATLQWEDRRSGTRSRSEARESSGAVRCTS